LFHQAKFQNYARSVYKRPNISGKSKRRLKEMVRCQHSGEARRNARRFRGRLVRKREAMLSVTPYKCGKGRYAIPCYIVQCESRFDPGADNGSHYGYYQLQYSYLGGDFSVPHQHVVAARLWRGGAGRSHWVCA
jgi:hypothetical protein